MAPARIRWGWACTASAGVVLACAGCGTAASRSVTSAATWGARFAFGPFAGYVDGARVRSLSATITVPGIRGGATGARAGTWIGAQAPSAQRLTSAFIQAGVDEERSAPAGDAYYAFWTDTAHGFHPRRLFAVAPGDAVAVSLILAGDRWTVGVADRTARISRRFSTTDEGRGHFDAAEFIQEDIRNSTTHRLFPYPLTSPVRFAEVTVDGVRPRPQLLASQWMSENGGSLGPGAVAAGAFVIAPRKLSDAGRRYLEIARAADVAAERFDQQVATWRPLMPGASLAGAAAADSAALSRYVAALDAGRWPAGVRALARPVIAAARAEARQVRAVAAVPSGGRSAWREAWVRDVRAVGMAAGRVHRALDAPQMIP